MARRLPTVTEHVPMPITPMLDMTFQLLAFFVLTFQPASATEGKLDFALPADKGSAPDGEPALEVQETVPLTVVVKGARDGNDGNIGTLIVRSVEGEIIVGDLDALRKNLISRRGDGGGGIRIQIAAEGSLKYACVLEVFDTCVQSGCDQVGFASPP